MPTDPSAPDAFDDEDGPPDDSGRLLFETNPETSEADAAEQLTDLLEEPDASLPGSTPDPANPANPTDPADAAEQARVVEINDEDYR